MSYISENKDLLIGVMHCIARQFDQNCEVVLHDLTLPYHQTIVAIENGHITGRKVGDSGTNTGLEILRGSSDADEDKDNPNQYNYINYSKNGRILRSSSHYFKEDGKIVGSLCINYDITDLVVAQRAIYQHAYIEGGDDHREIFSGNVDELLDVLFHDAITSVGKPVVEMNKDDKVKVVSYLDQKGAFLIRKSAETISDFLGISKFTLYNYLDIIKESSIDTGRDSNEKESAV